MRVLMTGGYGCIGSWVAKELVEQGEEVWIYDLKEDTHRIDMLLDAGAAGAHPFRRRGRVGPRGGSRGRDGSRGDAFASPGGPADADLPGQSGARVPAST